MPETDHQKLGQLADRITKAAEQDRVSVGDLIEAVGHRSLLPLVLVPALLAATPLSGIPGLSAICGIIIALVSFQMLLSVQKVRLPGFIKRRSVKGKSLKEALEKSSPVIDWIDRHTRHRLTGLFHRPMIWVPRVLCLLSGLAMPFLEVIPFSASTVAIGVVCLTLSLLTCDGLLFLLALLPYALGAWLVGGQFLS